MFFQKFEIGILLALMTASSVALSSIKVAIPNKVKNLDPRTASIAQERFMLPLILESLFAISEDGQIQNQIAKSWEFDEGLKQFKVMLAHGHRFSDGSELTSEDVAFSFKQHCRADNATSKLLEPTGICETPLSIDKHEESTLIFKINDSPNDFLFRLGSGRLPIFKSKDANRILGSGQFKVDSFEETKVILKPNEFNAAKPLETLEFVYVAEHDIQKQLSDNLVDVATMYLGSTVSELKLGSYKVVSYSPVITQSLILNSDRYPFNSAKFRQTFYALLSGNSAFLKCKAGSVRANGFIPNGIGGSIATEKEVRNPINLNLVRLKKPASVNFVRHLSRKNSCEESLIISAGEKLNLKIQFRYSSDYGELSKIYANKSADGYLELYVFSRDASLLLSRLIPGTPQPIFYYTDKNVEELLKKASKENLLRTRFQYFRQVTESMRDHASVVPLYYESHTNVLRPCLYEAKGELKPNPNSFLFLLALPSATNCSEPEKP